MKRLISAGILFVIVIASYLLSLWYINDAEKETKNLVSQCEQAYSDGGDAYDKALELKKLWDRIAEIERAISELCVYSKSEEENDFKERIENIKMLLHQIDEDTKITVHSIF